MVGPKEAVEGAALLAGAVNFVAIPRLEAPLRVTCKIRYKSEDAPATIEPGPEGGVITRFDEPQRAITPGQSAVWYDGDVVVGGGIILKDLKAHPPGSERVPAGHTSA